MTKRPTDDATRIAGLREAITAAHGDWHETTALWSVQADLHWLLTRAEAVSADDRTAHAAEYSEVRMTSRRDPMTTDNRAEPLTEAECPQSKRADGLHSWVFDGDDPYVICAFCSTRRDALTSQTLDTQATTDTAVLGQEELRNIRRASEAGRGYGGGTADWNAAWLATLDAARQRDTELEARPEIVCLCGSTRFYDMFQAANYDLTMLGKIVLSVGFYPHSKAIHGHGEGVGHDSAEKVALDELHKRKIDLADYVYVLNVDGYIGESTRSEIVYAEAHGKRVDYLEPRAALTGNPQ